MINTTHNNKHYTFILPSNWPELIQIKEKNELNNDVYAKYKAILNITGEVIICNEVPIQDQYQDQNTRHIKMSRETYAEYQEYIAKHNFKKEQWVYNIFDGVAEQDRILYKDSEILIIPNYKWNTAELKKIQILTFILDKSVRCLRDLNIMHLNLLTHCKNKTLEIIKNVYGIDAEMFKIFLHYGPSAYQLHIHFVLITNTDYNSSVEYSHELSSVIYNIEIKHDYYQSVILNKRAK